MCVSCVKKKMYNRWFWLFPIFTSSWNKNCCALLLYIIYQRREMVRLGIDVIYTAVPVYYNYKPVPVALCPGVWCVWFTCNLCDEWPSIPYKSIDQINVFFCRSKCWTTPAFHFQWISLLVIALAIHFTIWIFSASKSHFSWFVHDSTSTIIVGIESKSIPLIKSIGCLWWFPALRGGITGPQWLGGKSLLHCCR